MKRFLRNMSRRGNAIDGGEEKEDEMAVRSKRSAIVTQSSLNETRAHFERAIGLLLLVLSVAGSVIAFNGGWENIRAGHWSVAGILAGAGVQLACTMIEWFYRTRRSGGQYLIALFVDAGTSVVGFGPIFHDRLAARIPVADDLASWLAWGIIGALALLLAFVPESALIDDPKGNQDEQPGRPRY